MTLLLVTQATRANDGAYFASGNHLIPIVETEISVNKEILEIKRQSEDFVQVNVDYEFFNPGSTRTILVGFEAPSPHGDVDGTPVNGHHPYIKDFTVNLNDVDLPFTASIVTDDRYYQNGKVQAKEESEVIDGGFDPNSPDFYFVYHFDARFKHGINKLRHQYTFRLSGSVDIKYDFNYILTGALRWSNQQIDDFTLNIDLGQFQDFRIANSFFASSSDWSGLGAVKILPAVARVGHPEDGGTTRFYVRSGAVSFKKRNFRPAGELNLFAPFPRRDMDAGSFDHTRVELPFALADVDGLWSSTDKVSFEILRNLPYARRGCVFRTPAIQDYYARMDWYVPDPSYEPWLEKLTEREKGWLKAVKENGF